MSVGSRAQDDRRRRRLAVTGDSVSESGDGETGAMAVLRERSVDLPAASPWLPRVLWKRCFIGGTFWLGIIAVATLLVRPFPPHPQLAPAIDHLVGGARPVLSVYADIVLWSLAASLATLVGWFRSHSQLDFRGRYRLWTWAALVFAAWGFCAGTGIHTAIGAVAGPQLRWPIWRAEIVVWLVPAMAAGLSVWWIIGRDLRRSRLNCVLVRLSVMVLLLTGAGRLYQTDLATVPWFEGALLAGQYLGMGLLITGLWLHAGYVAYVCADPPEATPAANWRGGIVGVLSFLARWLWPFRRGSTNAKSVARKTSAEADAAPKRRRKTAAKPKRRTPAKAKSESDEESYGEDTPDDDADESASEDEEWTEEDDDAPPAKPVTTSATARAQSYSQVKTPTPAASVKPAAPSAASSWSDDDSDEGDSDSDDDANYRVDGAHGGTDPFKGLSKRQRRELKKQMRDQQRQQRG